MPPHRTTTTTTTNPHTTRTAPTNPRTAPPLRPPTFDPYNSSATGHQRSDNRLAGSTSWRASRSAKLTHQFGGGAGGGKRVYDSVGAGSLAFGRDGRKVNGGWERGAVGLRGEGQGDVRGWVRGEGRGRGMAGGVGVGVEGGKRGVGGGGEGEGRALGMGSGAAEVEAEAEAGENAKANANYTDTKDANNNTAPTKTPTPKKIFTGLTVYINGSTAPRVSDHRLKHLLAEHGARVSIALARRTVTHVVLGTPSGTAGVGAGAGAGAGGGLAAGKLQREMGRVRGRAVKYVGVEWVLASIEAGKRLPEARFETLRMTGTRQKSMYGLFKRVENGGDGVSGVVAELGGSVEGS